MFMETQSNDRNHDMPSQNRKILDSAFDDQPDTHCELPVIMAAEDPVVRLWRAVLWQAISDLHSRQMHLRDYARRYITSGDPYFLRVCEMADVDPETIIKFAQKKIITHAPKSSPKINP